MRLPPIARWKTSCSKTAGNVFPSSSRHRSRHHYCRRLRGVRSVGRLANRPQRAGTIDSVCVAAIWTPSGRAGAGGCGPVGRGCPRLAFGQAGLDRGAGGNPAVRSGGAGGRAWRGADGRSARLHCGGNAGHGGSVRPPAERAAPPLRPDALPRMRVRHGPLCAAAWRPRADGHLLHRLLRGRAGHRHRRRVD